MACSSYGGDNGCQGDACYCPNKCLFHGAFSPTIAVDYFSPKIIIYYKKLLNIIITANCAPCLSTLNSRRSAPSSKLRLSRHIFVYIIPLPPTKLQNFPQIRKNICIFRKKAVLLQSLSVSWCLRSYTILYNAIRSYTILHHPTRRSCHCGSVGRATHS